MNGIKKSYAEWVAVDWGTSNFRYWVLESDKVLKHDILPLGMQKLNRDEYEEHLIKAIGNLLDPTKLTPILICGMAGSRQGWSEAPYLSIPSKPPDLRHAMPVNSKDRRISVRILPGLRQSDPADIMRGEETQIRGILDKNKNFDGVICLPGTHTKWVRISAGEVVNFQTFMTGEMFFLLSEKSVLKHSVSKGGWVEKIFRESVNEIITDNKLFAAKLFNLRSEFIMENLSKTESRTRLSGYLIGLELAGSRPYWLGQKVLILGEDDISLAYEQGLDCQGVIVERVCAKNVALDGLKAIYKTRKELG